MALSSLGLGFVVVDVLLRRLLLPFVLISAVIFRYNLFSFVYLLLFIVALVLPGPRLKSQKASNLVFLSVLLVFSAAAALGQCFFQISLATNYTLTPCEGAESVWRQVGFVQFDIPAVDVVRLLLPDVVVFLAALLTLLTNVRVVTLHGSGAGRVTEEEEETGGETGEGGQPESHRERGGSGSELADPSSSETVPPYDKTVQCYWRIPILFAYSLELGIFVALGLSGVAVPSLVSFVYYVVFLSVLIIWSVHLRLSSVVRVIRAAMMIYSSLHLLLLDLYQFSSAQQHIAREPTNTTQSLLARLFGLTPLTFTDCSRPSELLLTPGQQYTAYLSPVFVLALLWLLATDFRMWLFTPKLLWRKQAAYFLPILDSRPSSSVSCIVNQGSRRQKLWSSYGAIQHDSRTQASPATVSTDTASSSPPAEETDLEVVVPRRKHRKKMSFNDIWTKIQHLAVTLWGVILSVSYIFAIVCMMLWSVLYPSWPSLVFLLWSCIIWLIPRVNPKNSLFITSPLLVLYALFLLLLQYVYSLDLTRQELKRNFDLITECSSGTLVGCKSLVLLAKTCLAVVFFAAFHESVRIFKKALEEWWNKTHDHTDDASDSEGEERSDALAEFRSKIYKSVYRLLQSYWILAVVGAFLLVMLIGEPSLLKSVYMVFFFLFLVTYQVTENFWFYLSFPVWCLLVVYSALELVLVYTYQFDVVSDAWMRLYNKTHLENDSITGEELFDSIGLRKFNIDALENLLASLIPPAIFIAVMAMQLRYFRPRTSHTATTTSEEAGLSALDLKSLLPSAVRNAVNRWEGQQGEEDVDNNGEPEESTLTSDPPPATAEESLTSNRLRVQRSISTSSDSHTKAYSCYRFTLYAIHKSRELFVDLFNLFWRFLELHLHKMIVLVLFASTLTQISAVYWLLLLSLVIILPLPYFNPLSYPLVTLYLGVVSTLKMIYQIPLIQERYFNFTSSDRECNATIETTPGLVYNETYSPRTSDATWLGLHKAGNFANYIWLPIVSSLLLSLWFAARRSQARHYHSEGIKIEPYEKGSLFLSVTRQNAEVSVVSATKYLINHFFELYGVEVCWSMLAITVAVRVDVYGTIYGIILGLLLLTPRRVLGPVWVCFLLVHGVLLLVQYFFLLGGPPGFCLTGDSSHVYVWSADLSPPALKKWLFLTDDANQVLDKNLLYADFLVYILVCLQIHYFRGNPLRKGTPEQVNGTLRDFLQLQNILDYIKYVIFEYSFWVSLFLMFFTAASRVSLFGALYLLLGFFFLYRGKGMLSDRQRTRHISWAVLRYVTWAILLIRVSLQIIDCAQLVTWNTEQDKRIDCILVLLFNGACIKKDYYGSPEVDCPSGPNNIGLWVDALNFIVITLQIVIFDTQFSELVRMDVLDKERNAKSFRDVFDRKVTEIQEVNEEKRKGELQQLEERAAELKLTENKIDHILYAGVQVPEDIVVRRVHKRRDTTTSEADAYFELEETIEEEPKSKEHAGSAEEEEEEEKISTWKKVVSFLNEVLDTFIAWLESTSSLYRAVVGELKQEPSAATPEGAEATPFVEHVESYGSIDHSSKRESEVSGPAAAGGEEHVDVGDESSRSTQPPQPSIMTVEVHVEGEPSRRPSEGSYSAAVSEGSVFRDEEAPRSSTTAAGASGATTGRAVMFDTRGDVLLEELRVAPTVEEERNIREYEEELEERAKKYSYRFRKLIVALYYTFLAHSEYLVFFLIILNVILNGSLLSLVYVVLLFAWGLLSIPWPSKRFWLILIFYTMFVLTVKYGFQFHDIPYWSETFDQRSGLYPPRLIGILYRENFFANAAWDMLLLIALLIHRGLLKEYGLWTSKNIFTARKFFQVVWYDFKGFFVRLLSTVITQGAKDYYVPMFLFDILCFLTIIFGVNSFGVGIGNENGDIAAVAAVAEYVRTNYIPLAFIILLLLQFISMLVDRAIYIRHSLLGKMIFYFLLLVGWHVWLFFILPSKFVTGRPFSKNPAAQCIYFFKCCYFIVSALQIVAGYPTRIFGYFLAKTYSTVSWLAFLVYRLIPLLPELREVMDWAFTDTSLSLINWFKVQEIYAQLYLVKATRTREKNSPRDLGEKKSWLIKIGMGVTLLVGLVVVLWLPLLVISIINTASQSNPPVQVDIQVRLGISQPLLQIGVQQQNISQLTATEYNDFLERALQDNSLTPVIDREFNREDFRRVMFPGGSTSLWTVSPPARERLLEQLKEVRDDSNLTIPLEFSWSITRIPSSGLALETVSGISTRQLRYNTDNATIDGFISSLNHTEDNFNVTLPNLYPSMVIAPANTISTNYSQFTRLINPDMVNVSCSAELSQSVNSTDEWWSLYQDSDYIIPAKSQGLQLIVYSERIAPPLLSAVAGIGILGLYVSVVLVIGRLIRGYISDLPSHLIVDEILNPDPLLKLCNDIFLVRENKDFRLEEILVGKLFFIFRSPERIVKLTENVKLKQD